VALTTWPSYTRAMPGPLRRGVLIGVLGLALVAPASTSATVTTFGSSLAAAPNATFGCELGPFTVDGNFDVLLSSSGAGDCTWRQQGVFGSLTDPRAGSVPGDGRITQVQVRAGANPAPLRFVIFRQLGNVGGTTNSQCCFFVRETAPVTLQPNRINTFRVNIPVERNTLKGIRAYDLVGISAAANTGSLPILEVGPHNLFATNTPGAVDAGYFYPRIGSIPNDTGGGRPEQGYSGAELTVRWTWVSANDPLLANAPVIAGTIPQINGGRAGFPLRCTSVADCVGLMSLLGDSRGTRATAARTISYGKGRYSIKSGKKATVRLKLSSKARALLRRKGRLKAKLKLTPPSGKSVTRTVTLRG